MLEVCCSSFVVFLGKYF
uniref:Uncharacterized protein n=1 Tax=Arundo donax TaxID=35708 RepID=A0A0A8Z0Z6_ARUDO